MSCPLTAPYPPKFQCLPLLLRPPFGLQSPQPPWFDCLQPPITVSLSSAKQFLTSALFFFSSCMIWLPSTPYYSIALVREAVPYFCFVFFFFPCTPRSGSFSPSISLMEDPIYRNYISLFLGGLGDIFQPTTLHKKSSILCTSLYGLHGRSFPC